MNVDFPQRLVLIACLCFCLVLGGCSRQEQREEGMSSELFNAHFSDLRTCSVYIDRLVQPVAKEIGAQSTVQGMRGAVALDHKRSFSLLVARVQERSRKDGTTDPGRESDQIKLTKYLYDELKMVPDFDESRCSVDAREAVMESLYQGVGGDAAPAVVALRTVYPGQDSKIRWVLLTGLLGGEIVPIP
jgi:hypothetical protein